MRPYLYTFGAVAAAALAGAFCEPFLHYKAVGFLFLLTVIAVGTVAQRGPTIFAAILSALAWNYFFIPPRFTFFVSEPADVLMNLTYFSVALAASILTGKIRRQAEELRQRRIVEESEKLYQTILDSVSHEMRTPITAIMGAASALQDPKTASVAGNRASLTDEVMRASLRLNQVVENLLDMSRMSTGKLSLHQDLADLSETVEAVVGEWKHLGQITRPVKIDAEPDVYAQVDTKMLRNVLSNLLNNAVAHSAGGIEVRVTKNPQMRTAVLEVWDEGKGIPDEDLEKIFQRFYRVPGTPSGGMGLGLSIVEGIIEAHGGRVRASNRPDRNGSIFRIELPLWTEGVRAP